MHRMHGAISYGEARCDAIGWASNSFTQQRLAVESSFRIIITQSKEHVHGADDSHGFSLDTRQLVSALILCWLTVIESRETSAPWSVQLGPE